jgi:hypothetical protein
VWRKDSRRFDMTPLTPLMKRLTDFAIILGVTAAISLVIIVSSNSLVAKSSIWHSYSMWLAFIGRNDIVATSVLAVAVSLAFGHYQQSRARR